MKIHIGTMYRIIVEKGCGCKATQEYKDAVMKEPDGEPTYKPCHKHKKGIVGGVIQELMVEVLENKAEEYHSKAIIAIAESNAGREAPTVSEGATSETRTPLKV